MDTRWNRVCVVLLAGGLVGGCACSSGGGGPVGRGDGVDGGAKAGVLVEAGPERSGGEVGESLEEFGFVVGGTGVGDRGGDGVQAGDSGPGDGGVLACGVVARGELEEVAGWRLPRVRGEALPGWGVKVGGAAQPGARGDSAEGGVVDWLRGRRLNLRE